MHIENIEFLNNLGECGASTLLTTSPTLQAEQHFEQSKVGNEVNFKQRSAVRTWTHDMLKNTEKNDLISGLDHVCERPIQRRRRRFQFSIYDDHDNILAADLLQQSILGLLWTRCCQVFSRQLQRRRVWEFVRLHAASGGDRRLLVARRSAHGIENLFVGRAVNRVERR